MNINCLASIQLFTLCILLVVLPPVQGKQLVIKEVAVVDVEKGGLRLNQTIVINQDKIVSVGRDDSFEQTDDLVVLDGTGRYLIPGLWDMHVHSSSDRITRETMLPLYIANGVTGVRDMKGDCFAPCDEISASIEEVKQWRKDIKQGRLVGPHIVAGSDLLNGPQLGEPSSIVYAATKAEGRALAHLLVKRGVDFAKPYSLLPRQAYFGLASEAVKLGLVVAGHVPLSVRVSEAVKAGQRSIEHQLGMIEQCSRHEKTLRQQLLSKIVNDKSPVETLLKMVDSYSEVKCYSLIQQLADADVWVVPTLMAQRFIKLDPKDPRLNFVSAPERAFWEKTLATQEQNWPAAPRFEALHVKLTAAMYDAGVKIMAGTDAAAPGVFVGFDLHNELLRYVSLGMTPAQALSTATITPAEYLGLSDRFGSILPGKIADLVLLNANPLENIAHTQQIHAVISRGRLYDRNSLDLLLERVKQAAKSKLL